MPALVSPARTPALAGWLGASLLGILSAQACANQADQAYVIMGPQGKAIARWLTTDATCPDIRINGHEEPMHERVAPAVVALRPTASPEQLSKPSRFDLRVCEYTLPEHLHTVSIDGQTLPLPHADIRHIVVIGDTGCRLKAGSGKWQDCNDPASYPFGQIARSAAAWHPDLVIHVGDYLYRENACPADKAGCKGSPWGYGSDAWQADFFDPARPLLAVAPWIVVRGNHESCQRAGQGWWRFLDPHSFKADQDCDLASQDNIGNFSAAYAVPLGGHAQVIVLDTAAAPNKPIEPADTRFAQFARLYRQMAGLASQANDNIVANHQPILGFAARKTHQHVELLPGNPVLQQAFASRNPQLFPDNVQLLLSGHVHTWEQVGFANDYPSQFVTGFSGTQEETVPLPAQLPADATPAHGARVNAYSSWASGFGYMTLDRTGPDSWSAAIRNVDGQIVDTCVIQGKHSRCADLDPGHPSRSTSNPAQTTESPSR